VDDFGQYKDLPNEIPALLVLGTQVTGMHFVVSVRSPHMHDLRSVLFQVSILGIESPAIRDDKCHQLMYGLLTCNKVLSAWVKGHQLQILGKGSPTAGYRVWLSCSV
jgi:hypothetical protein